MLNNIWGNKLVDEKIQTFILYSNTVLLITTLSGISDELDVTASVLATSNILDLNDQHDRI